MSQTVEQAQHHAPAFSIAGGRGAVVSLAVVSLVMQIPFLNRGISLYDEGSILAIADGLRHGEALYRDRATPLAPMTYELMRILFDIFGAHLLVGRILQAIVFTACVLLVHAILRECTTPRWALCGAVAFLPIKPLAFPFWTVVNYSQIAMLFCLLSAFLTLRFLATRRLLWIAAAGFGAGMTIITKQNLGAFLCATLAAAVALDAVKEARQTARRLLSRLAVLAAGVLPPLIIVVALYAMRGTLGDLYERAVVGLLHLVQPYGVPLPWAYGSGDLGPVIFTYFPTPLAHLFWQGRLNLFWAPLLLSIGVAVKATYFGPLLALLVGGALIVYGVISKTPRADWSRLVLIVTFAAMAYASMLYRADWTHLMNISPALLILCVVVLHRLATRRVWAFATLAAGALWLTAGGLAAAAVFAAYQAPLETPRGRLLVPASEADDTRRVLDYVATQPPEARILFLRSEPLYYFLTGRRIPGAFDLVMPGLLAPGDDERISRGLSAIDEVIYNPKLFLTVHSPITQYAPITARTLSRTFRVAAVIGPTAFVLRPVTERSADITTIDLWDRYDTLQIESWRGGARMPIPTSGARPVERTSWMMYRVLATNLQARDARTCISTSHDVREGEAISALPMLNPVTWAQRKGDPDFRPDLAGATFDISVEGESRTPETVYRADRAPAKPEDPIRIPLDAFTSQHVEIRLCTAVAASAPAGPVLALAGWAEPRIVRAAIPGSEE